MATSIKVEIKPERCKECGLCIKHCPKNAISLAAHTNQNGYHPVEIDNEKCIGCGICYTTCPDGVYHVLG